MFALSKRTLPSPKANWLPPGCQLENPPMASGVVGSPNAIIGSFVTTAELDGEPGPPDERGPVHVCEMQGGGYSREDQGVLRQSVVGRECVADQSGNCQPP